MERNDNCESEWGPSKSDDTPWIPESQEIEDDLPPFSEFYKKAKREFAETVDDEHDSGDNSQESSPVSPKVSDMNDSESESGKEEIIENESKQEDEGVETEKSVADDKKQIHSTLTTPVDEDETKVASKELASDENKENVPLPSPRDVRIINIYLLNKLWYTTRFLKLYFKSFQSAAETPREKESLDLIKMPSTPRLKRTRSRFHCECSTRNVEFKRNLNSIVSQTELLHNVDIQSKRQRLSSLDRLLSSEFVIGKELIIRVVMLCDAMLDPGKRVVITISSDSNEIRLNALSFLKSSNSLHRVFASYDREMDDDTDKEIELCEGAAYVEVINDEEGLWMLFRQYIGDYVSDRIYMSARTWLEFRDLLPTITNCAHIYIANIRIQESFQVKQIKF
jgi:hypothetical protein